MLTLVGIAKLIESSKSINSEFAHWGLKLILCSVQRRGSIHTQSDYNMIMFTKKEFIITVTVFLPCTYPVLLNSLCQYQHLENNASNIVFSFGYRSKEENCSLV